MRFIIVFFVFVSFPSFANENQQGLNWAVDVFASIYDTVKHTPTLIEKIFAYVIEYALYIKFYLTLESMKFAYGVAQTLMVNIGLDSLITDAISALPVEYSQAFRALGFLKGMSIICEAFAVRFVLNFMGW